MSAPGNPAALVNVPEGAADRVKACCAAAYSSDLVAQILGDSYHPGGAALTRRLAELAGLRPGERVLDVASGPGSTALLLAREHGVTVDGVDLSADAVARASAAARAAGLAGRVTCRAGDAEGLPAGGGYDAVVCECALCTFPGQEAAAGEFARVLRPGGRAALADVTIAPGRLDERLAGLTGQVACLAGARPLDGYTELLEAAGLRVIVKERHDGELVTMIDQIEARLRVLRMTRPELPGLGPAGYHTALEMTALARDAVAAGAAGYALVIAEKPGRGG